MLKNLKFLRVPFRVSSNDKSSPEHDITNESIVSAFPLQRQNF
ncbi:MAG: hypothetical protein RM338_24235 [Nostoc sp. DedQUE12a]|nr:hypothetical protein [Nostoc sp. DedQUE12a]